MNPGKPKNPTFNLIMDPKYLPTHSPGILTIMKGINFGLKSFKFMKGWLQHHNYRSITKSNWEELTFCNPQFRLVKKLKRLSKPPSC